MKNKSRRAPILAPLGATGTVEQVPPDVQVGPGWEVSTATPKSFLLPQVFQTQAELIAMPKVVPKVLITELALMKILIIVTSIEMEVGWLGTARRKGDKILVDDIYLFNQHVSFGHSELTTDSMASIMREILLLPKGEDVFNNIRFWGHSHGNGGTSASSQDDLTMRTFQTFGADFFLRGIFNRKGGVSLSLYDYSRGVAFHEVPWRVVQKHANHEKYTQAYEQLGKDLPREMQEKIRHVRPVYRVPTTPHVQKRYPSARRWTANDARILPSIHPQFPADDIRIGELRIQAEQPSLFKGLMGLFRGRKQ